MRPFRVLSFYLLLLLANVLTTPLSAATRQQSPRQQLNFNTNWAFHKGDLPHAEEMGFDDSSWDGVTIPHVMHIEQKHNGGGNVFQGIGWYRRHLNLPGKYKNKRLTIHFDGVQMNCEVFLNGDKLAQHFGGYMGFSVDITAKLLFGRDNVLAVKVTNTDDPQTPPGKPMRKLDFNYYGGIYRNFHLVATEPLYISDPLEANKIAGGGLLVSYENVSPQKATVKIQTHIVNAHNRPLKTKLVTSLLDKNNRKVGQTIEEYAIPAQGEQLFHQQLQVSSPKLWHPDHPYLYRLVSSLYASNQLLDEQSTKIGIRSLSFTSPQGKPDGFYLNGEKLYLRGANRHQAYQYVGDAASDSMQYRDARQLKAGGFNSVRASHYPASPAFLDACDELGLLVIECQPGWQFYSGDSTFTERSFRDIREMVRRDRNRPSLFLWETSLNESPTPSSWMQKAVAIAHEEMPGNQMFTADDLNQRSRDHYDVFYKVTNPDGTDPLPNKPSLTREWGDTWYADASKENGLRASRMYTEKGLINQSIMRQNALNGSADEKDGGYWDHARLDANPRIGGYFLWSYNDYTRGSDPITAFSGVVDEDRYPKFGYYQMQSMQDARNRTYGPMVFIASDNNTTNQDSVIVFSNCDAVRLTRNGKPVGTITRQDNAKTAPFIAAKGGSPYYKFNLASALKGDLKAEGLMNGRVVCTHTVKPPEEAAQLKIEVATNGIQPLADGSDMTPIYIKVCDKNGTLISNKTALEKFSIELSVSGEGHLIGANLKSSGVTPQSTEGGIAYALIRSTNKAGKITVTAHSQGLKGATLTIKTRPSSTQFVPDGTHAKWTSEYEKPEAPSQNTNDTGQPNATNRLDLKNATISLSGSTTPDTNLTSIIDGNLSTTWLAPNNTFPITLLIDLNSVHNLTHYQIFWGKDSDWYTHSIDLSPDNEHWTPQEQNTELSGQDYSNKPLKLKQVRFIHLTISAIRPEKSRLSIRELQLFTQPEKP
ncbi:DUF4982 domain-containing protein [bacterium]|nr:MAG: DUF4982 domain-containing protein [bacterium]